MLTTLSNMPVLKHQNFTGFGKGRQTVRADDDRAPLSPLAKVMQNLMFSTPVNRGQRIIQYQDLSVQQQRAGNRDTLFCPPESITPRSPTSVS